MYRELGQEGVQFGLRQGPYAGGPRSFTVAELPDGVASRLRLALNGAGHPEPLLRQPLPSPASWWLGPVAAAALTGALAAMARHGFATPDGLHQGVVLAAVYVLGAAGAAVGARAGWQRATHALPQGTFLLPLDVVEVSHDTVTVTPLGGVRRVAIEEGRAGTVLSLSFAHGARFAFAVGSEREAEAAYERLEQSQSLLETLSQTTDLEQALDLDPFFSLRGTGAAGQPAGGWDLVARRVRPGRWALAALVGAAVGVGAWRVRNLASDKVFFDRAVADNTIASYTHYLAYGRAHRAEATHVLLQYQRQASLDEENARFHAEDEARRHAAAGPCNASSHQTSELRLACLRTRKDHVQPAALAYLEVLAQTGLPLSVAFRDRAGSTRLREVERRDRKLVVTALQRAFDETFTARVIDVVEVSELPELGVDTLRTGSSDLGAYAFGVRLMLPGHPRTFELTMPPPAKRLDAVRDRSLFTLAPDPSLDDLGPAADQALTARAYDRLYDELFALFFHGDPRVPLR